MICWNFNAKDVFRWDINLRIWAEGINIRFCITIYQKYNLRYNFNLAFLFLIHSILNYMLNKKGYTFYVSTLLILEERLISAWFLLPPNIYKKNIFDWKNPSILFIASVSARSEARDEAL